MCEKTIKKSETTTKRDCDEWIDGEGKFHRKVTEETITGPMDLKQATFLGRQNRKRFIHPYRPKPFWKPMYPMMRSIPNSVFCGPIGPIEPIESKSPETSVHIDEFVERQKKILEKIPENKSQEKPVIDVKEFIEKGKKILSGMGIDVENEIKNLFTKPKEGTKTDLEIEEETLNQKKEVKTWQKNKPLKKQKQKNQNQKKKK